MRRSTAVAITVLLALLTGAGLLGWALGWTGLVVQSGSMAPALEVGSLAVARPVAAAEVRPGDVVSVSRPGGGRITHRVVEVGPADRVADGHAELVLRGDANPAADPAPYPVDTAGLVVATVPYAGYAVAVLTAPAALVVLGVTGLTVLVLRRRRRVVLVAGVATGLMVAATSGTAAAFTDSGTIQAGAAPATAFSSGALATPATPTATQQTTSGVPAISWTSTAVTTGGGTTTAAGYEVYRYAAATGGTGALVCTTTTALTCNDTRQAGTGYYAVRARFATSWVKESARRTYTPDATGPTVTFTRPANGFSGSAGSLRAAVTCAGGTPACGTTSDTAGVTSVRYTMRADPTGSTIDSCWNGSAWVPSSGACTFASTTGTAAAWRVPGSETTAYPSGNPATITITVQATDAFGNVTTSAITVTVTS